MAYYHEHTVATIPLDEHVKMLGDEDLMDFWEESQYMEGFFHEHDIPPPVPTDIYERLILQELQLRFCQRGQPFVIQPGIEMPCPF